MAKRLTSKSARTWKLALTVAVVAAVGCCWSVTARSQTNKETAALPVLGGNHLLLPDFTIYPGGMLDWGGKVRLSYGGGEDSALPDWKGLKRALPGGNLVLEPVGDYKRSALDLLPCKGKVPEMDAICEFTLHRFHPSDRHQEMLSISALGTAQDKFAVVIEAHGDGKLKPLSFMVVDGGLPKNPDEKPFSAEAMRVTPEGTVKFASYRSPGHPLPIDAITVDRPKPESDGAHESNYVKWVGKTMADKRERMINWRANVRVDDARGRSAFVLKDSVGEGDYANKLEVTSGGDVELPATGGAVILKSPNGKRWRVTVDDSGSLKVSPAK